MTSCSGPKYDNPHVLIDTRIGEIELELFPDKAPLSVKAFLSYVESGLYDNAAFYRVLKAEEMPTDHNTGIIQGGVFGVRDARKVPAIPHEPTTATGLSHTDGAVSFASLGAGTATSEFFICIGDQSVLDAGRDGTADKQGYAVFARVFKGMKIVRQIQDQPSTGDRFIKKIGIKEMKILD